MHPLPGELLTSCLARNAYAHGSTPYRFLNLFWEHDPVWNRDFDRDPTVLLRTPRRPGAQDWLGEIAERLGTARSDVEDATLAAWRLRLGKGVGEQGGDTPLVLSAGVFHRKRRLHALQFCPACLSEGVPHFRKAWRLGFVVACEAHGLPLMDACGWCDAPVAPHRSMTVRLTDCGACGKPVAGRPGRDAGCVPPAAVALQRRLLAALDAQDAGAGPLDGDEAFATIRALLAASAPARAHAALRKALGLGGVDEGEARRRFEHCRHGVRASWLETVVAWLDDWPRNFLVGVDAIKASGRTFARCRLPPALAAQVERLPARRRRPRKPWEPLLDEPVLRKLRRTDRAAYSRVRAERILAHCGILG